MSEHDFCRHLLGLVMEDVRDHTTVEQRKAAWAWKDGTGNVEFHGPGDFYWHGEECCLWAARSNGWSAWLAKNGVDGYAMEET